MKSRIIPLSVFLFVFLSIAFSQNSFAEETLDFDNCNGFLSADELKSVIGYDDDIIVDPRDVVAYARLENPSIKTMCTISFLTTDRGLVMLVGTFYEVEPAIAKYNENLDEIKTGGYTVNEYYTFWKNFDAVLNESGIGSLVISQYDKFFLSFLASIDEDKQAIANVEDLRKLSAMVQKKILDLPDVPISPPNPIPDDDVGSTIEPAPEAKVPEWIKNNAGWWADGAIGDSDFASGLEYLIKEKIILVSEQTISNFEDYYVVLHLNLGKIIIEFFPDEAPNHVEKFFELTQSGFYDGTLFHRVIPGFMIQGGDPNTKTQDKSIWGTGSPGYTINEEFNSINHNRGIVSMARSADPDSAGSQFFIVHQDSRFLDGQYTVFGKIVTQESFDTLDKIASTPVGDRDIPKDPSETLINRTEIISKSEPQESTINQEIPDWVKNNAGWWADGLISEDEFLNGIKYMIEKGIIRV